MEAISTLFGFLGFFAAAFFAYYYSVQAGNKERMALIERGTDLSGIFKKRNRLRFPWITLGMTIVGVGIGGIASFVFVVNWQGNIIDEDYLALIIAGSFMLFGGLGMVVGQLINRNIISKERKLGLEE